MMPRKTTRHQIGRYRSAATRRRTSIVLPIDPNGYLPFLRLLAYLADTRASRAIAEYTAALPALARRQIAGDRRRPQASGLISARLPLL